MRQEKFYRVLKEKFIREGKIVNENGFVLNSGWEDIFLNPDDTVVKKRSMGQNAHFTGRELCDITAIALSKCVPTISNGITAEVVSFDMNFSGIDKRDDYVGGARHVILKLTQGDKTKYVDAAYAQIDQRYIEQLLVIDEAESTQYYPEIKEVRVVDDERQKGLLQRVELFGLDKYGMVNLRRSVEENTW